MAAFRDFGPKLICSFWGHFTADFFMGAPLGFDLKSTPARPCEKKQASPNSRHPAVLS